MKTIKVGIMSSDKFEKRMLDIAMGKYKPSADEPKIWFSSLKSMAEVLSENNVKLLELIEEKHPSSVTELAKLSGRTISNLSRTLKTFERYGIVEIQQENSRMKKPVLSSRHFQQGSSDYSSLTFCV